MSSQKIAIKLATIAAGLYKHQNKFAALDNVDMTTVDEGVKDDLDFMIVNQATSLLPKTWAATLNEDMQDVCDAVSVIGLSNMFNILNSAMMTIDTKLPINTNIIIACMHLIRPDLSLQDIQAELKTLDDVWKSSPNSLVSWYLRENATALIQQNPSTEELADFLKTHFHAQETFRAITQTPQASVSNALELLDYAHGSIKNSKTNNEIGADLAAISLAHAILCKSLNDYDHKKTTREILEQLLEAVQDDDQLILNDDDLKTILDWQKQRDARTNNDLKASLKKGGADLAKLRKKIGKLQSQLNADPVNEQYWEHPAKTSYQIDMQINTEAIEPLLIAE